MSFLPHKDWTPEDDNPWRARRDEFVNGARQMRRSITIRGFDSREELIEHLEAAGATPEDIEKVRESFREAGRLFWRTENGD